MITNLPNEIALIIYIGITLTLYRRELERGTAKHVP